MSIEVEIQDGRTEFEPGESVAGTVTWQLGAAPTSVEVRLFWCTRGKGTTDVHVAKVQHFDAPGAAGRRPFTFVLPDEPYSFSGKLISLVWAVEAVVQPGERCERVEIVVAPGGSEVQLNAAAAPSANPSATPSAT